MSIAVVIVLVGAAIALGYTVSHRTQGGVEVRADGPTFYQALAALNTTVGETAGGPWTLFGAWGIATPLPLAPDALDWNEYNLTVNGCQAQFDGLTLWNGSIPLFNGTYNSGTAPFWQFAFFSNTSASILVATDVLGALTAFPPMAMTSVCAVGTLLSWMPWDWARVFLPYPPDTPKLASTAWNLAAGQWMGRNQPAFEAYVFGSGFWGSGQPGGLNVRYERCGLVGATDVQPELAVVFNNDGTWSSEFNGTQGCGDVISMGPPPVTDGYTLVFNASTFENTSNATAVATSFQVTYSQGGYFTDANGLVSWMSTLNLSDNAGQRLQSGTPGCPAWVPSLADCPASATGWYAVLESKSGAWLDSYPAPTGGNSWAVPNVALASNQRIVVVAPATWNLTGDNLVLNGTVAACPVNGTASL